jgi:hypothetical protein
MASTNLPNLTRPVMTGNLSARVMEDFQSKFVLFVSWPNHCFPVKANQCQYLPKRTKMSREIALTILIPLFIVSLSLFATSVVKKFKQWRKRRTMERGLPPCGIRCVVGERRFDQGMTEPTHLIKTSGRAVRVRSIGA